MIGIVFGWSILQLKQLTLNPDKFEAILIGSQARPRRASAIHELRLDNVSVKLAQSTEPWRDHRQQVATNRTCH